MEILLPPGWPRPKGFSHGIAARGRMVFVAGQLGWDTAGKFPGDDLAAQLKQTLQNTLAVLQQAGAGPQHVARMTWYITSRDEYLRQLPRIGEVYREVMGRHYPAMAVVVVAGLMEPQAKIEIETTAVVPD